MNNPRYAKLAARLLRTGHPEATPPSYARERGVATIERAMQQLQRRQRYRWWATGGGVAVAAATLLWFSAYAPQAEPSSLTKNEQLLTVASANGGAWFSTKDGRKALQSETTLPVGALVSTMRQGEAQLQLSTGTRLGLSSNTELQLASNTQNQRFILSSGSMQANVHELSAEERFVVITPDSEVEVVGTTFRLSVLSAAEACGDGLRTRLEVVEGVVEVRADARSWRIGAGQRWPADCEPVPEPSQQDLGEPTPEAADAPEGQADVDVGELPSAQRKQPTPAERSVLREQSDLFGRAAAAGRRGNTTLALRLYGQLLSRFPHSALAENAMVSRMRLLASSGSDRARSEAKRYLARFPQGFAREEARRVLAAE